MGIYSSLQDALYNLTIVALDEFPTSPVIFSHQSGTEPPESYVAISILDTPQIGHGSVSTRTQDTTETLLVQAWYEVLVQFSFVGSLSGDMAYSFNQRINNNPLVLDEIRRNNLGLMRKSSVRRSPQKRETKWVEYHNIDVTFNYNIVTDQVVDLVEAVILQEDLGEGVVEFIVPADYPYTP